MAKMVTAKTLDNATEFDRAFTLSPDVEHNEDLVFTSDARATYLDCSDHAPNVSIRVGVDDYGNLYEDGLPFIEQSMEQWSFFSAGYSGEYRIPEDDPGMHWTESVGGRLAADMIEVGGTFVITAVVPDVIDDDNPDAYYEPESWVVLRKNDD